MERPPEHTFPDSDISGDGGRSQGNTPPWWNGSPPDTPPPYAPPPYGYPPYGAPQNTPPWTDSNRVAGYAPPGYGNAQWPARGEGYGAVPYGSSTSQYPMYPEGLPAPAGSEARRAAAGNKRSSAAGWALGSAILAALSKVGILVKVLLPFLSAVVSFGAYALLFGWQFGVGLLALLFLHEMGHFVVIRAKGMPATLPVFIPLVGAYVAMRRMPSNVRDEAEIAIAGPLAGALGSIACFGLYEQTHLRVILVLAYFNCFINLLNLIPVAPLDGGRIVGAISRWFWPLGLVLVVTGFLYTHSLILILLAWLGFTQTLQRFRASGAKVSYFDLSILSRLYITVLYFGLALGLAVGMLAAEQLLHP
jgi:Zn-dependent protease